MASNGSPDRSTWHSRRRRVVQIPMLIGLLLLALAAWRVASRTVTIAYDPQQVDRVDLASRVVGRHPLLDPGVLALVLMGVVFLVAAALKAVNLVLGS